MHSFHSFCRPHQSLCRTSPDDAPRTNRMSTTLISLVVHSLKQILQTTPLHQLCLARLGQTLSSHETTHFINYALYVSTNTLCSQKTTREFPPRDGSHQALRLIRKRTKEKRDSWIDILSPLTCAEHDTGTPTAAHATRQPVLVDEVHNNVTHNTRTAVSEHDMLYCSQPRPRKYSG